MEVAVVEMFEARSTEGGWGVWENGVQRWAARQDLAEDAARAIAQFLNEGRTTPQRTVYPQVKRALVKIGSEWLTCEVHDWLRTPGADRWEAKVVVWVDQDYVRPAEDLARDQRGRRRS